MEIIYPTQSKFLPHLPFTTTTDCLINIVVSAKYPSIPINNQAYLNELTHTFSIHDVSSLGFAISNKYLVGNNSIIDIKLGYFRLISKYNNGPIIFLMFTTNILETIFAIEKSGFQTSDLVVFFSHVHQLNKQSIHTITSILHLISKNHMFKPFSASIIFFDLFQKSVYILCYFCDSKFGQLQQVNDNLSLINLRQSSLSLNSNGFGKTVLIAYPARFLPTHV